MGWVLSATPRPLCPLEKAPLTIVLEAVWTSRPVWTGAEDLASHLDSIPEPFSP